MSWNKCTTSSSKIDVTLNLLKKFGKNYKLSEIGFFEGNGLNDEIEYEKFKIYKLRKLEYEDVVIMERIVRQSDCDADDIIESKEFKKGKEPKKWPLEITYDNENGKYSKEKN